MFQNLSLDLVRTTAMIIENAFFIIVLIAAAFIDFKHRIIPNILIGIGFLGAAIIGLFNSYLISAFDLFIFPNFHSWSSIILGSFLGFAPLFVVNLLLFVKSRSKQNFEGFGGGDIKLMALGGFYLGPSHILSTYFYTALLTLIVLSILLLTKKIKRKDSIPFGPFLSFGMIVSLISKLIAL